jgi:hypothetical protein
MIYECKRCGHQCKTKSNLISHLQRKTPCEPIIIDTTVESLIEELTHKEYNEITYKCPFCVKKFNSYKNRHRHQQICKAGKCNENGINICDKSTQTNISVYRNVEILEKVLGYNNREAQDYECDSK